MRRIALEAGEVTLAYFDESGYLEADAKQDGSPVTKADQEAEKLIEQRLKATLPGVPMIGEEKDSLGQSEDIANAEYFWLVDPLDGTKEFISGSGEYTVNIALIHKGIPILGVVYAPALGELYAGFTEQDGTAKAFYWSEETDREREIHVRRPPKQGLTVVASRSHGDKGRLETFLSEYKIEKLLKRGSSLKICSIAAGKADIYPRLGPTSEWDTAAGDAVLRAAGGTIREFDAPHRLLVYGGRNGKFLNPEFVASTPDVFPAEEE